VPEIEFDILLGQLLDHPAAKSKVPKSTPQAFDRRAKLFRDCAKLLLNDQHDLQKELIDIINEASSAILRAHPKSRLIHGFSSSAGSSPADFKASRASTDQ